jgi:hypothetical protein
VLNSCAENPGTDAHLVVACCVLDAFIFSLSALACHISVNGKRLQYILQTIVLHCAVFVGWCG